VFVFAIVWTSLQSPSELFGPLDIALLSRLVAARQQYDQRVALLLQIDSIAGSVSDAQLRDTLADRLDVAEIAERHPTDPDENP
jgi:hypothetical protein